MCKKNLNSNPNEGSVFIDLFSKKEYLTDLYKAMHPESLSASGSTDAIAADNSGDAGGVTSVADDLTITDIRYAAGGAESNYNIIMFTRGDRIIFVAEMKSIWTPNILFELLGEAVNIISEKLQEHKCENGIEKPDLPAIEFNIIYAKGRRSGSRTIKLSDEFFGGKKLDFDIKARVFYNGRDKDNDILAQYVYFCRTCEAAVRNFGCTREAKEDMISSCIAKGALVEYLADEECADRAFKMVAYGVTAEGCAPCADNCGAAAADSIDVLLTETLGTMFDFGVAREEAVQYAMGRFGVNSDYANKMADKFWKTADTPDALA